MPGRQSSALPLSSHGSETANYGSADHAETPCWGKANNRPANPIDTCTTFSVASVGLIYAGCDVLTVQKALGHGSPNATLSTHARTRGRTLTTYTQGFGRDDHRGYFGLRAPKCLLIRASTR